MNKPLPASVFATDQTTDHTARLIADAASIIAPLWPLETAIAVNPLAGFENQSFDAAVQVAAGIFNARPSLPLPAWRSLLADGAISQTALRAAAVEKLGGFEEAFAILGPDLSPLDLLLARLIELPAGAQPARDDPFEAADALIAKWCGAFFAEKAVNLMRDRHAGLYAAVLPLLAVDPDLMDIAGAEATTELSARTVDPVRAIDQNLRVMGLPLVEQGELLKRLVARLPGWAGHIRWRTDHAPPELVSSAPATIADLLALWTTIMRAAPHLRAAPEEAPSDASGALARHFGIESAVDSLDDDPRRAFQLVASFSEGQLGLIFMRAAEEGYRDQLLAQLKNKGTLPISPAERTDAQLVFCIDVRSEPMRRALEERGSYETFGYAGFFGVPVAVRPAGGGFTRKQLPVLLQPSHELKETSRTSVQTTVRRSWRDLLSALKDGLATTFTTAEASGIPAALAMLVGTFAPTRFSRQLVPAALNLSIPIDEQVGYAKGLFDLTGMTEVTSRLVVLVGHAGRATNNPYASALHCGACGGHRGGQNAKLLAAMLNSPAVRSALAAQGVRIREDTLFVAAEHDTTCDEVLLFDQECVPTSHGTDLAKLAADLEKAGSACRQGRAKKLRRSGRDLVLGSAHWGEVRPEWGLAGNAAFIVGPRSLTRAIDLDGRAFLHSYDWRADEDGSALATILTAPMVVAQWINCQYLFSTVDNDRYGAGDKITHNVLGGIGVVQGNGGDLRVGLPMQSLFNDDGSPFHIPQRLLTIVHAPPERIEAVVDSQPVLQRLFENDWVLLVCIDPRTGRQRLLLPKCSKH